MKSGAGFKPAPLSLPDYRRSLGNLNEVSTAHGSLTVSLQEAPHTSALSLRGSDGSVQFTLPLPLALGSRYLSRKSTNDPVGGFCETVALKTAPVRLTMDVPVAAVRCLDRPA